MVKLIFTSTIFFLFTTVIQNQLLPLVPIWSGGIGLYGDLILNMVSLFAFVFFVQRKYIEKNVFAVALTIVAGMVLASVLSDLLSVYPVVNNSGTWQEYLLGYLVGLPLHFILILIALFVFSRRQKSSKQNPSASESIADNNG